MPGQPAPVETYTVLDRSFRRSLMEQHRGRVLSPFVGREREMMTLHALLAQVEAGRGQVVGIVGEPGLGKSRLVYEFRRSLGETADVSRRTLSLLRQYDAIPAGARPLAAPLWSHGYRWP